MRPYYALFHRVRSYLKPNSCRLIKRTGNETSLSVGYARFAESHPGASGASCAGLLSILLLQLVVTPDRFQNNLDLSFPGFGEFYVFLLIDHLAGLEISGYSTNASRSYVTDMGNSK